MAYNVEVTCIQCGTRSHVIGCPLEGLMRWRAGGLIQNEMQSLSIEDRELLITRLCPSHMLWDEEE
jgi:hypothetical protein